MRSWDAQLRQRGGDERGFTLIELLVVILIIAILSAIAIPSFIGQKNKAYASQAQGMVDTMEHAAEAYATDHNGSYAGLSGAAGLEALHEIEPSIHTTESTIEAYAQKVESTTKTYKVTAKVVPSGSEFSVERKESGELAHSCTPTTANGCQGGTW